MRITAGSLRGRVIRVPDVAGLRPTPAKVRQALFNILGPLDDMRLLDLFSGSGVMALEAISRGASSAVSIELNRRLTREMGSIRDSWALSDRWQIKTIGVEKGLASLAGEHFELVFADPPYQQGFSEQIPAWLDKCEISCDRLIVEESTKVKPVWPDGWSCVQSRPYGDTCLHFLQKMKPDV
ncbi:16S rRNA (guanine966-N2)-methyltransferase [Mariprofundus micogutta]|uniref:16S rRNA (Guanine966-N2)-methyltransferase n=1 Tax=Mariprofundus micogutta TaxID=1921010 RepID=A0A1L8CMS4_9PROT|nr:RsmD family RNA methyltransferase [Mariprofundus micogutta]GAV20207.1 16S rRNA (guanine966-N2)-methyltransferase [Mariprofundus micogutta]